MNPTSRADYPHPTCFLCQREDPYCLVAPELELDAEKLLPYVREGSTKAAICAACLFEQLTGYPWRERPHPAWQLATPKIQVGSDDKKDV